MQIKSRQQELGPKRILVAIDGSESALKAVRVAARIARNNKAELTIVHVLTVPSGIYTGESYAPLDKIEREARQKGERAIAEAIAETKRNNVDGRTAILGPKESPTREITNYADRNTIDLIVTGTRGLGGFKRLLLGSVASGIVHYSHCSVLVVR